MHRYIHTTIKMSLASLIAIIIAITLGLQYAMTAGILAVLSMQLTRTDSLYLAGKRLLDAALAIALGTIFFVLFGYNVWVYSLFVVFFIAFSFLFKIHEGIVPSLVLASHLVLANNFDISIILNSFALIIIAVAVALGLNVIYPLNPTKVLSDYGKQIDQLIIRDLQALANQLKTDTSSLDTHKNIQSQLSTLITSAEVIGKDILFDKQRLPLTYLKMRENQMRTLKRLYELADLLKTPHEYTVLIGRYLEGLSYDIGYQNKALDQQKTLSMMLEAFRKKPLPENRDVFETRATLFQMTFEIETFLEEKIRFHTRYPDFKTL